MKKQVLSLIGLVAAFSSLAAQSQSQTFTSSGIFVVPAGVTQITVEMVGAGGDGGFNGGGGGGGGGYAKGSYSVTPGNSISIDVGIGGGGPNAGSTNIAVLSITAFGGDNGTSVGNPNIGGGGVGGGATGGTMANFSGATGGGGYYTYFGGGGGGAAGPSGFGNNGGNTIVWSGQCITPGGALGTSGGAPGGDGGKGAGFTDMNCNVSDPAGNGLTYGGGGGGGNGNGGNPGTGAGGICIITWLSTGIDNASPVPTVSVSPNPFTDKIQIQHSKGNENYELMNANGQLIWSGKNIGDQNFAELNTGVYFLRITGDTGVRTEKLVK
jgi:Secretion system C-terminal sorting domain